MTRKPYLAKFEFIFAAPLFSILLFAHALHADTLSLDFIDPTYFDSSNSTGIWNITDGQIGAGVAPLAPNGLPLNFGDGIDGDFSDGSGVPIPRAGLTIVGTNVTVDTDVRDTYNFKSFNLAAGYILTAVGSKPLVIRVLGAATISGTINADGQVGTHNGTAGLGNRTIGLIAGGAGGAGGGAGGRGGQIDGTDTATDDTAGTSGAAGGANSQGGGVGANQDTSLADKGGGGGCNNTGAIAGQGPGGAAGACAAAATSAALFDTVFAGGGGGGGGGACAGGASCDGVVGGAGGGGAGGAVQIVSVGAITIGGTISAQGGDGGFNNADNGGASDCGGGGGGGSGGSIWLQSASGVVNSGGGTLDVSKGLGGVSQNVNCTGFYDGGDGSTGILRVDAASNAFGAASLAKTTGLVLNTDFVVVSKALDFSGNSYEFLNATETLACGTAGTLSVVYEGSVDGTTYSKSAVASEISQLNGMPYLRFKVTISATGATPPCLSALTIGYKPSIIKNFLLKGSLFMCGTINGSHPQKRKMDGSLLFSMLGDLVVLAFALLSARRLGNLA